MEYIHPKKYDCIRNQNIARLIVEENCLKCDKFMGAEHDFAECDLTGKYCPKPYKAPSLFHAEDFVKCKIEGEK